MKHITILYLFTLHFSLFTLSAAVPLRWTVETSRATPAQFEAYQGETLALEAALQSYGKPLEAPSNYSFYWQTNGMGSTYWVSPCTPPNSNTLNSNNSNTLFATWSPTNDVGARVYNCFIGKPGTIYHAAFQLRLRPSPGALPNVLPLPVPVIDFAKVRVLNPPWSGGGGGDVDTNAVRDIVREQLATNGIRSVDGAARPLPRYLHALDFADSYANEAAAYYRSRGNGKTDGGCSSVRDGGFLSRNFDYPFDERAEFVVKMSAGPGRFASLGVANVGTNLTEEIVTSGKWSKWYKALPGATVDGINENGVACNINVVDGDPQTSGWNNDTGYLHPLAAIRWILDNATNAQHAAEYIAANIRFPQAWTQNFHFMICDERETWVVENGHAVRAIPHGDINRIPSLTNFNVTRFQSGEWFYNPIMAYFDNPSGEGWERWTLLQTASITNAWYTNAYRRETNPPWVSDLHDVLAYTNDIFNAWAEHPKEYFRGKTNDGQPWWQTVHTSIYDLSNRVLRVSVQEQDDWYVFQVPSSGAKVDAYSRAETDARLAGKIGTNGTQYISSDFVLSSGIKDLVFLFNGEWFFGGKAEKSIDANYANYAENANNANYSENANNANYSENANKAFRADESSAVHYDENTEIKYFEILGKWRVTDPEHPNGFILKPASDDISADNPHFTNAVLQTVIPSLSTNITAEVYIAATNACANLGIDPSLIPQEGTLGTVGGLLVALAAAVALLRKKTKLLKSDGTAEDDFAANLMGKQVAISAIDERIKTNAESAAEPTNAVTLNDNAPKTVTVATATADSLAVTFGTARNGGLRICELYILNGTADTDLTFDAETVSFVATGDSFPACEAGINYFVFAEVAANLWKVTRETLKSITTPTPVAAA